MFAAVFVFVLRIFLEVLDIRVNHSFACMWSAIAILLAVIWVVVSYLNEISWAISARVLTWKVLARLMTMGIILKSAFRAPYVCSACRSGS